MNNYKTIIIGVCVFVLYSVGMWVYGYYSGIDTMQQRIEHAPVTTTTHHDSTLIPSATIAGNVHVVSSGQGVAVIPQYVKQLTRNVDSLHIIVEDLAYENQQLREDLARAQEPKYITIDNDKVGKLLLTYFPIGDSCQYRYTGPKRYLYVDTVFVTKIIETQPSFFSTAGKYIACALAGGALVVILK